MQIENDYDKEVYNGDIGYVKDVEPDDGELTATFDERLVSYGFGELDTLVPAYAATIPPCRKADRVAKWRPASHWLPATLPRYWRPSAGQSNSLRARAEAQLLVRGLGERSQHRLERSKHEAGFALQWDEVIRFVHAGRWNRIGARVGSDNGFCRKRLMIGDARKSDRRNQYAERFRAGVDRQVSRDGN